MKISFDRMIALAAVTLTFTIATASCKKTSNSNSAGGMNASVGGVAWAPSYPLVAYYDTSASVFYILGLHFQNGDSTGFQLGFFSPIQVNITASSDTSTFDFQYFQSTQVYDGSAGAGGHSLLTITSYDSTGHKIAGKFSGVFYNVTGGSDSVVITNGSFNTSFTVQ